MSSALKAAYAGLVGVDNETPVVLDMIARALDEQRGPVVDVGCGYGRYLRPLKERGIDAIGVDVNPDIVRANRDAGLNAMTPSEFFASACKARVMVFSHVIEHFAPRDLLAFLDQWLDCLEEGGEAIFATPLMNPNFYDDFDHVKPYHPEGLRMVFGAESPQVQYQARNQLQLMDVVIRRSPWRATLARGLYFGGAEAWPYYAANAAAALAFRLSAGCLGRKTGWIGRFRKVSR